MSDSDMDEFSRICRASYDINSVLIDQDASLDVKVHGGAIGALLSRPEFLEAVGNTLRCHDVSSPHCEAVISSLDTVGLGEVVVAVIETLRSYSDEHASELECRRIEEEDRAAYA